MFKAPGKAKPLIFVSSCQNNNTKLSCAIEMHLEEGVYRCCCMVLLWSRCFICQTELEAIFIISLNVPFTRNCILDS